MRRTRRRAPRENRQFRADPQRVGGESRSRAIGRRVSWPCRRSRDRKPAKELFWQLPIEKGPPTLTRRATAMHLHTYRDESRSWHLDLIGGRGHPWSIDLVVVIASGIMLIGLACAFAALLIR